MSDTPKHRVMYMHLIDGRPASFDGEQISFATEHPHWQDEPAPVLLRASLKEIRADEAASRRYRKAAGFDAFTYAYAIVHVPGGGEPAP